MNNELLFFLHIPKAAGSTFRKILHREYSKKKIIHIDSRKNDIQNLISLPESHIEKIRVLEGHFYFGLHANFSKPFKYITFLRHPIERIISLFYYIKRAPSHYLNSEISKYNMDIMDFVKSNISVETNNHQTRLISGMEDLSFEGCNDTTLELAKKNLLNYFTVIGITERFDESLLLIKDALNLNNVYYSVRNRTKNKPNRSGYSVKLISRISEHNNLDIELYNFAYKLFEEKIIAQGENFNARIYKFKKQNSYLSQYYSMYYTFRNTVKKMMKT